MKHLFENDEGETVAADTAEQAKVYWEETLGNEPEFPGQWTQLPDDEPVVLDDGDELPSTKMAVDWARKHRTPTHIASACG